LFPNKLMVIPVRPRITEGIGRLGLGGGRLEELPGQTSFENDFDDAPGVPRPVPGRGIGGIDESDLFYGFCSELVKRFRGTEGAPVDEDVRVA